jgi:hypothetical protein
MMKDYILELDRPRKLRFGFRSIRLLKDTFRDKNVNELIAVAIEELPAFVWAGLVWEDETLTPEKVETLLDASVPEKYRIIDIINIVAEAMAAQIGVEGEKKNPPSIPSPDPGKSPSA